MTSATSASGTNPWLRFASLVALSMSRGARLAAGKLIRSTFSVSRVRSPGSVTWPQAKVARL